MNEFPVVLYTKSCMIIQMVYNFKNQTRLTLRLHCYVPKHHHHHVTATMFLYVYIFFRLKFQTRQRE